MKFLFFNQFLLIIFLNIKFSLFEEINNGLYIIKNKANLNLCLKNDSFYFSSEESCHFLIHKKDTKPLKEYDINHDDKNIYYFIEDELTGKKLIFDEISNSISVSEEIDTSKDISNFLWEFLPKKERNNKEIFYEIKTRLKKYFISYENSTEKTTKVFCESSWVALEKDRETKIKLIQIYRENKDKSESQILEKEPIDVVIKFIDLNDKNLERKNLEQIEKDKQNYELKFSLRSIFKNIPWIRKIFIIMPNEKIDFLKDIDEIKEKIQYIKDSDLLGFDSSSPPAFQFNIHKLKQYNLSENFILMDDDYFIGQPLKKSELFYEYKGKIYPYIISTKYYQVNPDEIRTKYMDGMNKIDEISYHSKEGFEFRRISTLFFLYKIFDDNYDNNNFIGVEFTHNAIPLKISDLEEIYNSIDNDYKYSEYCLRGNKRNLHNLQPQILFMNYAKNKYNRFVNKIDWKYYDLSDIEKTTLDNKLFVINREDKEYDNEIFKKEESILEKLFPEKMKYEKDFEDNEKDFSENKDKNNKKIINDYSEANKDDEEDKKKDIKEKDINNESGHEKKNEDENTKNNIQENEEIKENDNEKEKTELEIEEDNLKNEMDANIEEQLKNIENEIFNQKNENKEKFENLLEEIKTIKKDIQKNSPLDEMLTEKLQELTNIQKELIEKISNIEKENKDLKKAQNELIENLSNKDKDKENKEIDNNVIKEIFNDIQNKNTKLEEQVNNLSEEKNSLITKLNSFQTGLTDKENQISKLKEENDNLKSKLSELVTKIETLNKRLENINNFESLLEQNEEKMNTLNNEISQLKQRLEQNKIKNDNELKINDDISNKDNNKENNEYKMTYILIFLFICIFVIYMIYRLYYGNNEGDPRKKRHMQLSSHSGYGSISSTSFM